MDDVKSGRYLVGFYGVRCIADVTPDSFELHGRTRLGTSLVNAYATFILSMIEFGSLVCGFLNIPYATEFALEIIREL